MSALTTFTQKNNKVDIFGYYTIEKPMKDFVDISAGLWFDWNEKEGRESLSTFEANIERKEFNFYNQNGRRNQLPI
jgi:hypothetical protein